MSHFRILGGQRLCGTVRASGSKNAALPMMAAAILADGPVRLEGVPRLADVDTLSLLLEQLGVEVQRTEDDALVLRSVDTRPVRADYELVRRMRASFCVLGPLVARRGKAVVSLPGGCNVGPRPVDLHLAGLVALGAELRIEHGYVIARAGRLVGTAVSMAGPRGPTVTGTANILSAAVLAQGRTTITGAAVEPEIVDLGRFLNSLARRSTAWERRPCRSTASASWQAVAIPSFPIASRPPRCFWPPRLRGARSRSPARSRAILRPCWRSSGRPVAASRSRRIGSRWRPPVVRGRWRSRRSLIPGCPATCRPSGWPCFSLAEGRSTVRDLVFRSRFLHAAELNRLGARIELGDAAAVIQGVDQLTGAEVTASDLRASAALVLAGLAAQGETLVHEIQHLDRGYQRLDEKLNLLGADVRRDKG